MAKKNIFELGLSKAGQPPIYDSPEELKEKIIEYFESLGEDGKPKITDLALFLGFASRQSIYDYKDRPQFSYIIKRACMVIESYYEGRLSENSPTGAIFALKNMGWIDKVENENRNTHNLENVNLKDLVKFE